MKNLKKLGLLTLSAFSLLSCGGVTSPALLSEARRADDQSEAYKVNSSILDDFKTFDFNALEKFNKESMKNADGSLVLPATLINFRPSTNEAYSSLIYAFKPETSRYSYFYLTLSATNEKDETYQTPEGELMPLDLIDTYEDYIRLAINPDSESYKAFLEFFNNSKEIIVTLDLISSLKEIESPTSSMAAHGLEVNSVFKFNRDTSDITQTEKAKAATNSSATGLTSEQAGYSTAYNIDYTITLEDPHAWSYRFDQDSTLTNVWEAFKGLFNFGGSDDLDDQVFYSFKLPQGWSKYEIANIDLNFKTLFVSASSYGVLSNQDTYNYFEYEPTEADMTIWNPSKAPGSPVADNTWPGARYSIVDYGKFQTMNPAEAIIYYLQTLANPIGYTLESAKASEEYKAAPFYEDTITPEQAETNIGATSYKWNKIQTSAAFKDAFKNNEEIVSFANNYMPTDDYQVINFASVNYSYSHEAFSFSANELKDGQLEGVPDIYKAFYTYLLDNGVKVEPYGGTSGLGYYFQNFINFNMFRFTDIEATRMELTNSAGESYVVNVSVEPVDEENSGGESEDPVGDFIENVKNFFSSAKNVLKVILIGAGVLIGIALLGWIISLFTKNKK